MLHALIEALLGLFGVDLLEICRHIFLYLLVFPPHLLPVYLHHLGLLQLGMRNPGGASVGQGTQVLLKEEEGVVAYLPKVVDGDVGEVVLHLPLVHATEALLGA